MNYEIKIPDSFASSITSAVQTHAGQDRPYAPHIYTFKISTCSTEVPRQTVLQFAQECCHKCPRAADEYARLLNQFRDDFHNYMCTVADGRYTLIQNKDDSDNPTSTWVYQVIEDYID